MPVFAAKRLLPIGLSLALVCSTPMSRASTLPLLDTSVAPVFDMCIAQAADGVKPDEARFLAAGYEKQSVLGVRTYVLKVGTTTMDRLNNVNITLAFLKRRCNLALTFVGIDLYPAVAWVEDALVKRGYRKLESDKKHRLVYQKGGVTLEVGGTRVGGQTVVSLIRG